MLIEMKDNEGDVFPEPSLSCPPPQSQRTDWKLENVAFELTSWCDVGVSVLQKKKEHQFTYFTFSSVQFKT
jgi:hypothetical protein